MKTEIEKLKEELSEAERDLSRESHVFEELKPRVLETQKVISGLGFQIEQESRARLEMLKLIALGEKEGRDLQAQGVKLFNLKSALSDAVDLLDAIQKAVPSQSRKVQQAEEKVRGKRHGFWFSVSIQEAAEIETGSLARSWAALVLSGAPQNLGPWLLEKFKGLQFQSESVGRALEAEYLGDKDVKNHIEKEENYG